MLQKTSIDLSYGWMKAVTADTTTWENLHGARNYNLTWM